MEHKNINYLSNEEYAKAVGTLRLQFNGLFEPFNCYGLGVFIPGAITEAVKLCEDFGLRVRGIDKPISLEMIRRKKEVSHRSHNLPHQV